MNLKNDRIQIRNAINDDVDKLLMWWNNGEIMAHAGFPLGLKTTKEKVLQNIQKQGEKRELLIIEFEGNSIGEMYYKLLTDSIAEIGINICDFSKQNKGFGSECLCMLIEYLFNIKKIEKIVLDTNLKNKRAQKVYERIGFKKVKVDLESWKNQLRELQSTVFYEFKNNEYYK